VFGQWLGDEFMNRDTWDVTFSEKQKRIMRKCGLYYQIDEEGDILLGRNWDGIGDDETGAEFKQSVVDAFKEMGLKKRPESLEGTIYG
jgi:hypothetical protein